MMLKDKKNNGTLTRDSSWVFSLFLSCLEKLLVKYQSSLLDINFWVLEQGVWNTWNKNNKSHLTEVKKDEFIIKGNGNLRKHNCKLFLIVISKFSFMYTVFLFFPTYYVSTLFHSAVSVSWLTNIITLIYRCQRSEDNCWN